MANILQICCESERISADDADKVKIQSSDFCSGLKYGPIIKSQFMSYDIETPRIGTFYPQQLANDSMKVQL